MQKRLITVSKYLAKYLRHALEELGLTLQPGGWVPVDDLLAASKTHGFTISYDELIECVETNDKRRFSFDGTGDLIRANQGHSVEVDLQLEEREPPEVLYHGTVERFLKSIMSDGLNSGKRHHVHLSKDIETATKVEARRGRPLILKIDAERMRRDGHTFFLSTNGVWLTASRLNTSVNRLKGETRPFFCIITYRSCSSLPSSEASKGRSEASKWSR